MNLSTHVSNDDPRHYFFSRNSGLPAGYFKPKRLTPDAWVFIACVVLVAFLLLVTKSL